MVKHQKDNTSFQVTKTITTNRIINRSKLEIYHSRKLIEFVHQTYSNRPSKMRLEIDIRHCILCRYSCY